MDHLLGASIGLNLVLLFGFVRSLRIISAQRSDLDSIKKIVNKEEKKKEDPKKSGKFWRPFDE